MTEIIIVFIAGALSFAVPCAVVLCRCYPKALHRAYCRSWVDSFIKHTKPRTYRRNNDGQFAGKETAR